MAYKRLEISRFGGPEVLKIVEADDVPEPSNDEVRVKVMATGAAFTDIMIREGKYPEVKQKPPFVLGYDMVGVVDKLGEGVEQFKVGQMVADLMVIGACSEFVVVPAERLTLVPDGLDAGEAVSIILSYVTAYQMLHRIAQVERGHRVLIHGAGGAVGTAMIQLGVLSDLEVYGTASKAKHGLVSSLGAVPIDYRNEDFVKRIGDLTKDGVDAAFDAIGGNNLKRSFSVLGDNGKLVSYGFYNSVLGKGGSIPMDFLRLKLWDLLPNRRSASFYSIGATRKKHPDWFSEDLTVLFNLLTNGKVRPIIDKRMPMVEAIEAYELISNANVHGKIVLEMP